MGQSNNNSNDWRVNMFGPYLQENVDTLEDDVESPVSFVPTEQAIDVAKYEYIAIFIGANYCPHCREFAPTVIQSAPILETQYRTKVIFVSNDRDEENFKASLRKNRGIDYVMPYDLEKTKAMRDLFQLKTIPALMILRNEMDVDQDGPTIVTNARHDLADDPEAKNFPWISSQIVKPEDGTISTYDRLIINGKYGKWWELGHHANPDKPDEIYMDEHAVRARAGILNIITWIAIINVFFWKEKTFVTVLFPLVSFEFLSSMTLGLTPLAPIGWMGSLLAVLLYEKPYWKPARPKRFAWAIGLFLASLCLTFFLFRRELGKDLYEPLIAMTVLTCNLATWFESSCGFCLGCFIYNNYLTKWLDLEECQECKI